MADPIAGAQSDLGKTCVKTQGGFWKQELNMVKPWFTPKYWLAVPFTPTQVANLHPLNSTHSAPLDL